MSTSFNISKDKIGWYYEQARTTTNSALVFVLLRSTGLQADDLLADHDHLGALLAASNDEPLFTNYVRKSLAGVTDITKTIDDTGNRVLLDQADLTWVDAGGNPVVTNDTVGKLLICFDPNTTTGTDTDIIPLTAHDITATTDGNDLILRFHTDGSARVL